MYVIVVSVQSSLLPVFNHISLNKNRVVNIKQTNALMAHQTCINYEVTENCIFYFLSSLLLLIPVVCTDSHRLSAGGEHTRQTAARFSGYSSGCQEP